MTSGFSVGRFLPAPARASSRASRPWLLADAAIFSAVRSAGPSASPCSRSAYHLSAPSGCRRSWQISSSSLLLALLAFSALSRSNMASSRASRSASHGAVPIARLALHHQLAAELRADRSIAAGGDRSSSPPARRRARPRARSTPATGAGSRPISRAPSPPARASPPPPSASCRGRGAQWSPSPRSGTRPRRPGPAG